MYMHYTQLPVVCRCICRTYILDQQFDVCVCVCVRVLVCWSRKGSLSEQLIELSLLKQLRKLGLPDDPHGHGYVRMSCATGHAPHKHPMGILHCLILHKNVYI